MDNFTATMIAENADGYEAESEDQYYEAWQHLINTGLAWTLQGSFGRGARQLIDAGVCTPVFNTEQDLMDFYGLEWVDYIDEWRAQQ
tara:strand:- start:235 stop:495 length:261 start_codon:yes stop_codon:yes gene_type:complete